MQTELPKINMHKAEIKAFFQRIPNIKYSKIYRVEFSHLIAPKGPSDFFFSIVPIE